MMRLTNVHVGLSSSGGEFSSCLLFICSLKYQQAEAKERNNRKGNWFFLNFFNLSHVIKLFQLFFCALTCIYSFWGTNASVGKFL
jgi:hypothetical protein